MATFPNKIRILEILEINTIGKEPSKDSLTARFTVKAKWCDADIDTHIATTDPQSFCSIDELEIEEWSPNAIHPGIYTLMPSSKNVFVLLEERKNQEAA